TECIRDPVEKCEHRRNVYSFRDLVFTPSCIAYLLDVFMRGTAGGVSDALGIFQQGAFRGSQSRLIKLPLENRIDALITGSLNPQEVGMTVQSIGTAVQVGDIAGNHFLVAAVQMAFGEMYGVRKIDYLSQEVRARPEALDDTRDLLAPG